MPKVKRVNASLDKLPAASADEALRAERSQHLTAHPGLTATLLSTGRASGPWNNRDEFVATVATRRFGQFLKSFGPLEVVCSLTEQTKYGPRRTLQSTSD